MTTGSIRNRLRANRSSANGYVAQGGNFGIGLVAPGVNDNVIEDNVVLGNTNGITLVPGTLGNTFRRNLVVGNPPAQIGVDYASTSFYDVRNLSDSATNQFQANVCQTSLNAPCPALAPSLTASPNPVPVVGPAALGMTTISWTAPDAYDIEVRIGSPNGALFAGGSRGSAQTGLWVPDGMTFYLQDVTGGKQLTAENTLATLVVRLQRQ
jgi:parallel beta-helix repeat protein